MNIVIDTNVILSALYSNKGASNLLMKWLFQNTRKINIISIPLVAEFEDVLTRETNMAMYPHLSREDINRFIDDICLISKHQEIYFLWRPFLSDPKDDMVLETAFNGNAHYIVTHNLKDFKNVNDMFAIQPLTPKAFLQIIGEVK